MPVRVLQRILGFSREQAFDIFIQGLDWYRLEYPLRFILMDYGYFGDFFVDYGSSNYHDEELANNAYAQEDWECNQAYYIEWANFEA